MKVFKMRYLIKIVLSSVLLAASIMMPAQDLPSLAKDGTVTTGALANGISYYLVTNSSMKGIADFALVRNGSCDTLSARAELLSLPHFNKTVPYKFLSRKGIGCRPEGYIDFLDNATLFRFDDVPVFDQAASDTTLLMLFDLIAVQPYKHAVIISGDINPATIIQKMNVFSMMVPSRNPSLKNKDYKWRPSFDTKYSFVPSDKSSVSIDFRFPRTPLAQMNTIQPFISKMYSLQLAEIVKCRLNETLQSREIPPSDLSVLFQGSDSGSGDEHFTVNVETTEDRLIPASMALASTLSGLGSKGVDEAEYLAAKKIVSADQLKPVSNSTMVDRCIASYLYGADLASPETKIKFLTSRTMNINSEVSMFNNYIEALLKETDDASVAWTGSADNYDDWAYPSLFKATWNGVSMLERPTYSWNVTEGDTLTLWSSRDKVKLKSSAPEPVSGGEMWTFTNGLKVIYKKTSSSGSFNYALMIKGGYSSAKDLGRGEGAFFSDMLSLYDIGGMSGRNFNRMLQANGVEMRNEVSVSDLRISGSAPSSKFLLVLKSLLTIANDRQVNPSAFDAYCKKERAELKPAYLDSLLYPNYLYSSIKTSSGLSPQTQSIADAYFNSQFTRVNDGVITLIGDLSSEEVQKILCRYLGGFRVTKSFVTRPAIQYKLQSGSTTYTLEGSPESVTIALASAKSFTIENNMAFRVAGLALKRALAGVMAECGFSVAISERFKIYPQESMELIFSCSPVPESGLPEGIKSGSKAPMRALIAARKAIDDVLSKPIDASELAACKSLLANDYSIGLSDPDNYINAVLMRYANGKDVLTKYSDRINSVSADKVKEIFDALASGRRIEYVVKK